MIFVTIRTLAWLVYLNINPTLGDYPRNVHGIPESGYGWILSLNSAMVVIFHFPITMRIEKRLPMRMMAFGAALLNNGFAMYGFFAAYVMFLASIAVIAFGEMVMIPFSNALVFQFAQLEMRGCYSFMYGLSWGISFAAGLFLAGLIMDNLNANWLWYAYGLHSLVATLGFLAMNRRDHLVASPSTAEEEPKFGCF